MAELDKETHRALLLRMPVEGANLLSAAMVAFNLAAAAASLWLLSLGTWPLFALGTLLMSLVMNHAYLIVHECGHDTFTSRTTANVVIGHGFSVLAVLPFFARQHEHSLHHRYSGSFHEPSTRRAMKTFRAGNRLVFGVLRLCWALWLPLLALNEHLQIWKLGVVGGESARQRRRNRLSTVFLVAAYAALLAWAPARALAPRLIPALLLYLFWIEFFNVPHHIAAEISSREGPVPLWEQPSSSKSCAPLPLGLGWLLCLDFNFHVAHHLFPTVPWCRLRAAHALLCSEVPDAAVVDSEWRAHRSLRATPFERVVSKYVRHQEAHS